MKLSIIIVNYNVRYFIEQAIGSIYQSDIEDDFEIIVVDNASSDQSVSMIRNRFPEVRLIANEENVGFSKANNQGIKIAQGEFILLLNPDTVLAKDTLSMCLDRISKDDDIGALGVRMIDGAGRYLPESKRGLPTPFVAFCKAFGLSTLFPTSKIFNKYHLGFLNENEEAFIDVLPGAFMLLRKSAIDKVGLLDESFFMYGEDIDLSYRIIQGGYKVLYFPKTSIIHYKGESTKKGSLNYVKIFYGAMIIFARKHFTGGRAFWMEWIYRIAVWIKAFLSVINTAFRKFTPMIFDALVILGGLLLFSQFWASSHFGDPNYYDKSLLWNHFTTYILVWILALFLGGSYDRYYSFKNLWRSLLTGTIVLFIAYAFLNAEWRTSRAILLFGSFWALFSTALLRMISRLIITGGKSFWPNQNHRVIVVGYEEEVERTKKLMDKYNVQPEYLSALSPSALILMIQHI